VITSSLPSAATYDETDTDDETNRPFVCNVESCQKRFGALKQPATHQTTSKSLGHGMPAVLTTLQIDNTCILCQTAFPNQDHAARHLRRAWQAARCIP
jgi:hypothetical protein